MKLLYIAFIDFDDLPSSGSSVRPIKMKQAFEQLNLEIITISGSNNIIRDRRKSVKWILKKLKYWTPDICYIEPPSGPFFYHGDLTLIKKLHKMHIPIAIFYRDAYWKYPDFYMAEKTPFTEKVKLSIIRLMQRAQWRLFNNNTDIIYFPSKTMAEEFESDKKDCLPPGSFLPCFQDKTGISEPIQFIFVGNATKNYGTFLTLDSFKKLNKESVKAKLFYICPKDNWDSLGIDKEEYSNWLNVIHLSGDDQLKEYYEQSDVAILTAPKTLYRDFAIPIKIFEYISYLKPILVTNCTETARVVAGNNVGWVCKDNVDSIVCALEHVINNIDEIKEIKSHITEVRADNLWIERAKKVISDLSNIKLRS